MRSEFLELVRLIKQVITCHRRLRNWNKITAEVKYCVSCWFGFNIQTSCSVQNSGSWLAHWPPVTGYTAWFSCCNDITARFLCCNELPSPLPLGTKRTEPVWVGFWKNGGQCGESKRQEIAEIMEFLASKDVENKTVWTITLYER